MGFRLYQAVVIGTTTSALGIHILKIKETSLGGPNNKDYSILGSLLGYPHFGKLPYIYIYIYIEISRERPGSVVWGAFTLGVMS